MAQHSIPLMSLYVAYATIVVSSLTLLMRSNLSVRICGIHAGKSRSTTSERIIAYVFSYRCTSMASSFDRVFMSCKTMLSSHLRVYPAGRVEQILSGELRLCVILPSFRVMLTRRNAQYAAMPAGIIRGALARMGFQAAVVPEVTALPQCTSSSIRISHPTGPNIFEGTFQVKLPKGS